ncbi:polysaccharide deacetylase family protein [Kushneria phosphatilytica]|uniref:Polysaccharide deacetylase n=1 Tax=Kushneria phosphatilytica TaxID=657387 RepID=A0A1S1NUF3_9GAMM|nr:polysaccharide deacetylase [Kushneria phosphatilytica]OHV09339.1 polysaccharide deacetylase [Kushneria phosphatilytica]QEL12301.1 polysaccharide deacetylase [Kushneria phosphatilytica]
MDQEQPSWQWDETVWRNRVEQVRAGERLVPTHWPNGARCAVALSFDSDHETSELRDGGKSIGRMSWGQAANRVGIPRILALLEQHDIPATFFVPAVVAQLYPEEQRDIIARGHEIGLHGWIHELNSVLEYADEKRLMLNSSRVLAEITGVKPVGMRTPSWDYSPHTLRIAEEMALLYDSSLMADEHCYRLIREGKPSNVIEFPVEWVRDDAVYFMMNRFQSLRPYTPPGDVFDIFMREFDGAWEEGGVFQLTLHPHIIGYRSRIWILARLIEHMKQRGDIWFATHQQVVEWARDHAG